MTLGAVLIVRNEAERIGRCVASARTAGVSTFTVVDTGSTDGTPEVLFDLGVKVHVREWVNFGHNRSEAFALARGTADWLFALDADMTVEWDEGWEPDPSVDAYMIEMGSAEFSWRLPLLLRGDREWKSVGAVHEYTVLGDGTLGRREPTDHVRIAHPGAIATPEKLRWHTELLEAEIRRNPDDPRTVFYLAQTYRQLGSPLALGLYRKRVTMGGWDEERFYSAYQAALLTDWPERAGELVAAWEMRPQRLEPLCALLRDLNSRGYHQSAYRLSTAVLQPVGDILFVDRAVDWQLPFERAIASWWTGHRDEFQRLSVDLLENPRLPDSEREAVIRNLGLRAA